MKGRPFEYRFYLDFSVNGNSTEAEAALNDLEEASAQGATMVRVGTAIFGLRERKAAA